MDIKLGSEDSQLSGAYPLYVRWRPVPCKARARGGSDVLCAKSTFFCVGNEKELPSLPTALPAGFSSIKGNPVLFFVYGSIIVGLTY